jgi:predicted DNA-binding transcriptional regulator AlpA
MTELGPIHNKKVAAKRCGLSDRAFDALLAKDDGPTVLQLSANRIGFAEADLVAWLISRRRPPRAAKAA